MEKATVLKKSPHGAWAIIEVENVGPDLYHECMSYRGARRLMVGTTTLKRNRTSEWTAGDLAFPRHSPWSSLRDPLERDWVRAEKTTRKNRYRCEFCKTYAPTKLAAAYKLTYDL